MKLLAVIANRFTLLVILAVLGLQALVCGIPFAKNATALNKPGVRGGTLVISSHSEPRTLNPLIAIDTSSRQLIGLLNADLIHINSYTQQTEPALAESWNVSDAGRRYTMHLRRGIRFSNGLPFDADDVVFSFRAYLDERVASPQRDLLIVGGKPIQVQKIDAYTVAFHLDQPYAAAERLFDSIAMLPHQPLEKKLTEGSIRSAWNLATPPAQMAGLGPFRLASYAPGQNVVLERNPFYWRRDQEGTQLPYLDRVSCVFAANSDAEMMRFEQGETHILSKIDAANFAVLERRQRAGNYHIEDVGAGLEYNFLLFNENAFASEPLPDFFRKQKWFKQVAFRRAISSAIDRNAIVRVAYFGRADAIATQVTPGNTRWIDRSIPTPVRSLAEARKLLAGCGFRWSNNMLVDSAGNPVRFSIMVNAGKAPQVAMATLIQQDLRDIGIRVDLDQVEFHTYLDRIFSKRRYEAAIMALVDGDADPNSEINVLPSTGTTHVWQLTSGEPPEAWQREIDELMQKQLITPNYTERKRLYDRVQYLVWENMPVIYLVSPHILVAARNTIGNFHPAILGDYALWNADRLFFHR